MTAQCIVEVPYTIDDERESAPDIFLACTSGQQPLVCGGNECVIAYGRCSLS